MSFLNKLQTEIISAQKSGDPERLGVLRFLSAQLKNREIEKRAAGGNGVLDEAEELQVFQKEAKKRKEAIDLYKQGGRNDLVLKENFELGIIYEFIPQPMSEEEIRKVVQEIKAKGNGEFNSLMREAMQQLKGKAEGKLVGEIVKSELG